MGKHTKEPWVLFEVGDRHVHFCPASEADKTSILTVAEEDGVKFGAVYNDDDARRIVACVNACRGLPTDELEQKGVVAAVGTQLLDVEQQRDELLAALEALYRDYVHVMEVGRDRIMDLGGHCDPLDVMERGDPRLVDARKAISKAKGGAA